MDERTNWIYRQRQIGVGMLVGGVALGLYGIALQLWIGTEPFNTRIVSGLGILLIGIGIAYLIRYRVARQVTPAAAWMFNEEHDERNRTLLACAGNRAFWVSLALAYAGLMWVSSSSNGSLPVLSQDALWYYLATLVVVPFGVFAISLLVEQRRS